MIEIGQMIYRLLVAKPFFYLSAIVVLYKLNLVYLLQHAVSLKHSTL